MREREPVYFVVWCEGGGTPTTKHLIYATAMQEAKRLACANPGKRFTVMVSVVGFEIQDLKTTTYLGFDATLDDEIPF